MSDLTSLMKYAPGSAGFMMGQNNTQSQQSEALRQQELKQLIAQRMAEEQRKQQMAPLEMDKLRLGNEGLAAGLPGITADSKLKGLNAQFTEATNPAAIEGTTSKFANQVDEDKFKMINRFQDWTIKTGVSLEQTPPLLRKQALLERLQAAKMNPDNPMVKNFMTELNQMDPQMWPKYFGDLANKLGEIEAKQNPAYRASTENSVRSDATTRRGQDISASTSRYVANKGAESRIKVAELKKQKLASDIVAGVKAGTIGYEKAATHFEILSMMEEDETKAEQYAKAAKSFQEAHLRAKREGAAGRPNPEGVGVQAVPPQEPNLGSRAAPAAPPVAPPTGKTKSGASYTIIKG